MTMDRIAQIALTFFGALLLILLIMGLAVSCRETAAEQVVTPTFEVPPTAVDWATMTPDVAAPSATSEVVVPDPAGATVTPTPSPEGETPIEPPAPETGPVATSDATTVPAPTAELPSGSGTGGMVAGTTIRHGVSRGEWLLQISRCYGANYRAVLAANSLPNPDYIVPGQILTIPAIGSEGRIVGPPCVVAYTVVAGDTWESLAQRTGSTAAILRRANPGALVVGRSIWVPRVP